MSVVQKGIPREQRDIFVKSTTTNTSSNDIPNANAYANANANATVKAKAKAKAKANANANVNARQLSKISFVDVAIDGHTGGHWGQSPTRPHGANAAKKLQLHEISS